MEQIAINKIISIEKVTQHFCFNVSNQYLKKNIGKHTKLFGLLSDLIFLGFYVFKNLSRTSNLWEV